MKSEDKKTAKAANLVARLKTPKVSFEAIRELVAYAEHGSVSKAARALGENQPTVTRRLRQAFGRSKTPVGPVIQIDKKNRLVGLTPHGNQILSAARDLVRQFERLADAIAGRDDVQQVVRLGVGAFGTQHYVPSLLAALQPDTKGWLVEVVVCRGRDRILRTAKGELNLAVVTHNADQIHSALEEAGYRQNELRIEPLADYTMCIVAAQKTRWAKQLESLPVNESVSIAQLAQFELVGLDQHSGIRMRLEQWAEHAKRPLYFVPGTEAGGWNAAYACMLQGLGAAILPAVMLNNKEERGSVARRLSDKLAISDFLICRDEEMNTACEAVSAELSKLGSELANGIGERSASFLQF